MDYKDLGMKSTSKYDLPINPAKQNGASKEKVGVEYSYSTSTTDLDMDNIYYFFYWDDGSISG